MDGYGKSAESVARSLKALEYSTTHRILSMAAYAVVMALLSIAASIDRHP